MKKLIFLFFILFFSACGETGTSDTAVKQSQAADMHQNRRRIRGRNHGQMPVNLTIKGDTVFVPEGSNVFAKLKVETVKPEEHFLMVTTTGVIKPLTGHMAEVTAPFNGRIVKSFIRLGQKVTTGSPLFEMSSSEYLEAVKMCIQAQREREIAEKNYIRKKELEDKGISSVKELDEAKLALDIAQKECEKTNAIMNIFNINPGEADIARPLIVRSPIAGEIVRNDITVGQYITSDSQPIVTVADLSKVWVVARVKETDIGSVNRNCTVEVFTESMPDRVIKGEITYIGNIMNEQTRSVDVNIECGNDDQILKLGMFATVRFYHQLKNSIVIPAGSVMQDFNRSYLYEQIRPGIFVKREVSVTSAEDGKLIVRSGLEPGRIIVSEGAIYLR